MDYHHDYKMTRREVISTIATFVNYEGYYEELPEEKMKARWLRHFMSCFTAEQMQVLKQFTEMRSAQIEYAIRMFEQTQGE